MVYRIAGGLLGEADLHALNGLSLRTFIDLRGVSEDRSALRDFSAQQSIEYRHIPIQVASIEQLGNVPSSAEKARTFMAEVYRELVELHGQQLAAALSVLDSSAPIAFGCAAGKDRTGVLAALLNEMLGVTRELVVADYVASAPNPELVGERLLRALPPGREMTPGLREVVGVQPEALLAALGWIDETWGGVESYLLAMGVTPDTIDNLRQTLVVPAVDPIVE